MTDQALPGPDVITPVIKNKPVRVSKTMLMTLDQLYVLPKITPSVEAAIVSKEDFSIIQPTYCEKVCKIRCQNNKEVRLLNTSVDILIIQDHAAPNGKYDRRDNGQELIQQGIINFICQKAGFTGLTYRLVSLSKCKPTETDFPRGKAPTSTVLSKCKPYLYEEIDRCKPKVIISLSTLVTKLLGFKKHSNTGNRGHIVKQETGAHVVITLHPRVLSMIRQNASGKMWSADYMGVIVRDFKKAAQIVRGELIVKTLQEGVDDQRKNITICKSLTDVQNTVQTILELKEDTIISLDLETSSLDPWIDSAKILTIQFGWRDPISGIIVAHVIPLWHRENNFFNPNVAWKLIVPIVLSEAIPKIGHNFKFDIIYMAATKGVRLRGFFADTMLLMHALSSGESGCYSLKSGVGDWCPELNISGYESLLPNLTRAKKPKPGDVDLENEEEETDVESEELDGS
jgi:hypothetical protein